MVGPPASFPASSSRRRAAGRRVSSAVDGTVDGPSCLLDGAGGMDGVLDILDAPVDALAGTLGGPLGFGAANGGGKWEGAANEGAANGAGNGTLLNIDAMWVR